MADFREYYNIIIVLQKKLILLGSFLSEGSKLPFPLSGESTCRFVAAFSTWVSSTLGIRSCPADLDFSVSVSLSSAEEEEELEEDEQLLLESDWMPVECCKSTWSARSAISSRFSRRVAYHFLDNLGLPRTVLCHTTGKLVRLKSREKLQTDLVGKQQLFLKYLHVVMSF